MKLLTTLVAFLFLTPIAEAFAQQVSQDSIKELSLGELKKAQDLYIDMMASDTYKKYWLSIRQMNEKLNGLQFPPFSDADVLNDIDKVRGIFRHWLTEHLAETKYTSIDEGLKSVMRSVELARKRQKENRELYILMAKASKEQIHEILIHEHEAKKVLIHQ